MCLICAGQRQQAETELSLEEQVGVCQCGHGVSQAGGIRIKAERPERKRFIGKGLFLTGGPPMPLLTLIPFPQLLILNSVASMLLPHETA